MDIRKLEIILDTLERKCKEDLAKSNAFDKDYIEGKLATVNIIRSLMDLQKDGQKKETL
ncbi:hypothetical protein [Wukongibacter sp. M2B1]|uniref:hypothetical protein n=1 Tax=Wukongibacter sp. M2B1 TaxID=3088895 RepID=UPI003D7BFDB8